MSQSLVKNLLHLVFSTRHRSQWISADLRPDLYAYQAGIFKDLDSPALAIGGVDDHVHVLLSLRLAFDRLTACLARMSTTLTGGTTRNALLANRRGR